MENRGSVFALTKGNSAQKSGKLLLVDDDHEVLASYVDFFGDDYSVLEASSGARAIELAREHADIAVAVLDIKMAPMDGKETGRQLRGIHPAIRVIFNTGHPGEYDEASITRTEDPFDFIIKGRPLDEIRRAVRQAFISWEYETGSTWRQDALAFGLVGSSRKMQEVYRQIYQLGPSDIRVLLLGETGTGKEMVARALHNVSPRRNGYFGIVPVGGDSTDQICATLFGAPAGAYTGLTYNRTGTVEYASEGTVFVDEIGEFPYDYQTHLLRVIDVGEYHRHGESQMRKTNARFICATHQDLEALIEQNRFRKDLYYRIVGVTITLPALRDRQEDIRELADYFIAKHTVGKGLPLKFLHMDVYSVLLDRDWPGNVRELERCMEALAVRTTCELILADDVVELFKGDTKANPINSCSLIEQLDAFSRTLIIKAFIQTHGEVTAAAELLGMDRSNLYRKVKQFGLDINSFRTDSHNSHI